MTGWYERRERAEVLTAALRAILREADDLDGLARRGGKVAAVLKGAARDLRTSVADLIDELHDELAAAAFGFDAVDVARGHPATAERIAYLLKLFSEEDRH